MLYTLSINIFLFIQTIFASSKQNEKIKIKKAKTIQIKNVKIYITI
jgi:hypothetical protein